MIKRIIKFIIRKSIKAIRFIDTKYLHGKVERRLDKWSLKRVDNFPDEAHVYLRCGKPDTTIESIEVKYSLDREMATSDLLYMQYPTPFIAHKFQRYDIPSLLSKPSKELEDGKILVDQDLQIVQGLEYFVKLLRQGNEFANVRVDYIDEWDKKKLYELYNAQYRENLEQLLQTTCDAELESLLKKNRYPFVLVLWPSSQNVWDKIEHDLAEIHTNGFRILDSQILHYTQKELSGFMDACYKYAYITPSILEGKKEVVINGCDSKMEDYPVKLITFEIDNPYYMVDSHTGQPFSGFQKDLKMNIRARYWNQVPNYGYDNIIHGTDNYLQSKLLIELAKINTDISGLYTHLDKCQCNYAIIKRAKEVIIASNDPIKNNRVIFNSDIDILTTDEDIQHVFDAVRVYAVEHFQGDWINIEEEKVHFNHGERYNRFLWVKLKDFPVVLFHIQSRLYGLTPQFLSECLLHKHRDNLQNVIDTPEYEVYLRLADLLEHPEKQHHIEYVRIYKNLISDEGVREAFGDSMVSSINKQIKTIIA